MPTSIAMRMTTSTSTGATMSALTCKYDNLCDNEYGNEFEYEYDNAYKNEYG